MVLHNNTGGDRGALNTGDIEYVGGDGLVTAAVRQQPGFWTWGGMWYSLDKVLQDGDGIDFRAIFGPYISSAYQGRITGVQIVVHGVSSPQNNTALTLRLEIKNKDNGVVHSQSQSLVPGTYPPALYADLDPSLIGRAKTISWIMDNARLGDSVSIDSVRLQVNIPEPPGLPTEEQAFLLTYSSLIGNYDPNTGLVQDRINFESGAFENISAAAKTAKITYAAYKKGYLAHQDAVAIITKIADTLISNIPRGPSGINALWPHITKFGGSVIAPGTEWAFGDTAYAALDIIAALQLIGDPEGQLGSLEQFVRDIRGCA